jgi:sec-independent protein translocase protein TatA
MSIGIWQVLIVVVLVFLLFGAGRLPRVMEDIAKGIKSFKKGLNEDDTKNSDKKED